MNASGEGAEGKRSNFSINSLIGELHDRLVYQRRIRAIAEAIAGHVPAGLLLDVGCGNGTQAAYLMSIRPDVRVVGLEVLVRLKAEIPLVYYSGGVFPFEDHSFESVLVSDTLHHIKDPFPVLQECLRVAKRGVFVKDHFYRNRIEHAVLRFLDIGANAAHGVPSVYNYFNRDSWANLIAALRAQELYRSEQVPNQYPEPFQAIFGRGIQFVSMITRDE